MNHTPVSGPRPLSRRALELTAREAAVLLTAMALVLPLVGALTITWRIVHREAHSSLAIHRNDDVAAGATEAVDRGSITEGLIMVSPDSGHVMVQCMRRVTGYRSWHCAWVGPEVQRMTQADRPLGHTNQRDKLEGAQP